MEPKGTWQGESHRHQEVAGGIVDIVFITQILLLRFGRKHGSYCLSSPGKLYSTPGATAEEVSLLAHYDRFREVEKGCG
jgi:glutamine synthetase adenylyltransferase